MSAPFPWAYFGIGFGLAAVALGTKNMLFEHFAEKKSAELAKKRMEFVPGGHDYIIDEDRVK